MFESFAGFYLYSVTQACWNWGILLTPADFELVNSTYAHQEQLGEPDNGINYREFIALMTNQTHYTPGGGSSKNTDNLSSIVRSKVHWLMIQLPMYDLS